MLTSEYLSNVFVLLFLKSINFISYPTALELVATGKINVKPLITHNYKMEDTLTAFETSRTGAGNAIKVLIHANPNWKF